ncbi:MAG: aspartate dehydrogenase domain-containing protein [Alphaproteobacteria bacterium]
MRKRIGLIGFGYVGRNVFERIRADDDFGLDVAFVYNRDSGKLKDAVPEHLICKALSKAESFDPHLIVEMAHPSISKSFGDKFLRYADYLPLSVTALADAELEKKLRRAAKTHQHRLLIPHGALMGLDSLFEWRHMWEEVTITFEKHPNAIDFSESGMTAPTGRATVYDGPARGIAAKFPRNVNTMVTCGLATVGLDKCRAVLIADSTLNYGVADVRARGKDGATLHMRKEQPMAGVSGTELFESQFHSLLKAAGVWQPLDFV